MGERAILAADGRRLRLRAWRFVLMLIFLSAAIGGGLLWAFIANASPYHFAIVQPGKLYRSGFHSVQDLRADYGKAKIRTIISLLAGDEISSDSTHDEEGFCRAHGIHLIRIPIEVGGWPSDEQLREFLENVQNPDNQPVLVHCVQGVRRTGMLIAAYQRSVLRMDDESVRRTLLTFGHSGRAVGDLQNFIAHYDPATETFAVPTTTTKVAYQPE
jgi:protein tyrosine/serine phosphatase